MGEVTGVEWTDHTHNEWWGCSAKSAACRFCYAETTANRFHEGLWSRKGPRLILSERNSRNPLRWNRAAERAGVPAKVFCGSMSDLFELHPVAEVNAQLDAARARLWGTIEQTPWLRWQLLTKRVENVAAMVPWGDTWPTNVWIGTTVESQRFADERIPALLKLSAPVRFLSCEPLLGELDLTPWLPRHYAEQSVDSRYIDWVVVGGETGKKARPSHPAWFRSLRDQCLTSGTAFFVKQHGDWTWQMPGEWSEPQLYVNRATGKTGTEGTALADGGDWQGVWKVGKKKAGRELDRQIHSAFPEAA